MSNARIDDAEPVDWKKLLALNVMGIAGLESKRAGNLTTWTRDGKVVGFTIHSEKDPFKVIGVATVEDYEVK